MITLIRDKSNNEDFQGLLKMLDEDLNSRYGVVQASYNQYNKTKDIDTVVIGYHDNFPVGCGCFKVLDHDTVEIKRMFVRPESRGSGIAMMILLEIEKWAIEKGFSKSILETGIKQTEAIRFYIKLGYTVIENYGQYIGNLNSICMRKELLKL